MLPKQLRSLSIPSNLYNSTIYFAIQMNLNDFLTIYQLLANLMIVEKC